MCCSGKGSHSSKSKKKLHFLEEKLSFQLMPRQCATQRLVTKPVLPVQLAVLTVSSAENLGSCLVG